MARLLGVGGRTVAQAAIVGFFVYLNLSALGIRPAFDMLTATVFLQLRPFEALASTLSGRILHLGILVGAWALAGNVLIRTPTIEQGARAAQYVAVALAFLPVSFLAGWVLFSEPTTGPAGMATVMTAAGLVFFCWPVGICCYIWGQWKRNLVRDE